MPGDISTDLDDWVLRGRRLGHFDTPAPAPKPQPETWRRPRTHAARVRLAGGEKVYLGRFATPAEARAAEAAHRASLPPVPRKPRAGDGVTELREGKWLGSFKRRGVTIRCGIHATREEAARAVREKKASMEPTT